MKQAIVTKYLAPTNSRGGRVKATAQAGSVTVPLDAALDVADNHRKAAWVLAGNVLYVPAARARFDSARFGALLSGGELPDRTGYCWVFCPREALKSDLKKRSK